MNMESRGLVGEGGEPPPQDYSNVAFPSVSSDWADREASEIIIGTYQYDHEALANLLEHRLRSRQALDLTILLDREMYTGKTPHGQRALVDRLKRLSAEVVLCRGTRATGSFHIKAVVADRRTAFVGSANITNKSARNAELCLVLRGPPVAKILEILHNEKARGFTLQ